MNIIIPIGGVGQRFIDEGYVLPKPLINVLGKPMIHRVIESFNTTKEDTIYIVFNPELNRYNFSESILKEFPGKNFRFIELKKKTRGAAETILNCLLSLKLGELEKNFLVADCDTFYVEDVLKKYRSSFNKNAIFWFDDLGESPIFSYVKLDPSGIVCEIKEKIKISNLANSGCYGFESGKKLLSYCQEVMDLEGELYLSRVYEKMIQNSEIITGIKVSDFDCVGTPLQLRVFCENNKPNKKIRVCFDLDNTLVSYPVVIDDYTSVKPIQKNIDYLKFLKSNGSHIIIYTARRMKTHKGNVGSILADVGKITIDTLDRFGIPYDELFFGKPHADFYVDDLAVNAFDDLDKKIGFYKTQSEARDFHKIEIGEKIVSKKTSNPGEIFWYNNIPEKFKNFVPQIYKSSLDDLTIEMERIKGVNFSYLYVNNALQNSNLEMLLATIDQLHSVKPPEKEIHGIYQNYIPKIKKRFFENPGVYNNIPEAGNILTELISKLQKYQEDNSGIASLIHGDPVFSNVILTDSGLKLIDPRGRLDEDFSIFGDKNYDLAKIYQSILGYDHILSDVELSYDYRDRMIEIFESHFTKKQIQQIKILTASLFFSLIPLHKNSEKKFLKYIQITKSLIT